MAQLIPRSPPAFHLGRVSVLAKDRCLFRLAFLRLAVSRWLFVIVTFSSSSLQQQKQVLPYAIPKRTIDFNSTGPANNTNHTSVHPAPAVNEVTAQARHPKYDSAEVRPQPSLSHAPRCFPRIPAPMKAEQPVAATLTLTLHFPGRIAGSGRAHKVYEGEAGSGL